MKAQFESRMKELITDKDLQKKLIPSFEAGCRRINPGEQFLVALQKPNVRAIFDPIEEVTATGVVVSGGMEHPADVLVAATGFDTTFKPRFPIIGRDGTNLQDLWRSDPTSYMGIGVSGFPNYLTFLGPNTPISNGSLMGECNDRAAIALGNRVLTQQLGSLEATSDYFIRLLRKVLRQKVKCFDVRKEAQDDFVNHTHAYMQDMVWTGTCHSWCTAPSFTRCFRYLADNLTLLPSQNERQSHRIMARELAALHPNLGGGSMGGL